VLGLRLFGVATVCFGGALGYAAVDERLLTRLDVGIDLGYTFAERYRPHLYVGFVHQHEESLAAVAQEPGGAVLGIGTGIRHRAGLHVGAGFDVRVWTSGAAQLSLGPELSMMDLGYSTGPQWYWFGGVTAQLNVRLF
jgi:hypothetical protein